MAGPLLNTTLLTRSTSNFITGSPPALNSSSVTSSSPGLAKPDEITASCHPSDLASAEQFKSIGATALFENKSVVERSEVVIVSVKPDVVVPALKELSSLPAVKNKLFITVLPSESRVIRVMPNTPALVQQGAAALSRGSRATAQDAKLATQLFQAVGTCDEVPEYQMDAVTALSGKSLAEGGVRCGLPRDLALRLASQTTLGAAAMLKGGGHPAAMKDNDFERLSSAQCQPRQRAERESASLCRSIQPYCSVFVTPGVSVYKKFVVSSRQQSAQTDPICLSCWAAVVLGSEIRE
ncbi:Pyrroline-5-carboxylate reductase [Operophtera brumata]|uniref:Pyrroline-5-carboxylate reductase n=1 Tax=Operophtera brumata TaxID=104452 RepID=A0A0L7LI33_OPEBR|nr:Pyrroline-5-carboxylate reductase [Operophtera brumata]